MKLHNGPRMVLDKVRQKMMRPTCSYDNELLLSLQTRNVFYKESQHEVAEKINFIRLGVLPIQV